MAKPDRVRSWIRSHRRSVLRPFLTAAFPCNKHRQRPADRCRGVPRHLSAPPRRTASLRCASGCVSGRRVGLVRQASSPTPASAARAEGVARRIRCWRGRRSEAAGDLPPELPVWRPRAGRRGVVVAGALPRRRRLAAAATPVRMSRAGPAAALALKTQSRLSAADNDLAATAAAGQALNAAAAAAAAAAPAAAAAAPARAPAYNFQAYRIASASLPAQPAAVSSTGRRPSQPLAVFQGDVPLQGLQGGQGIRKRGRPSRGASHTYCASFLLDFC